MAEILEIAADNVAATKFLESYIQSGNLNFLIGAGASSPAIKVAGTIETEINKLLTSGDEAGADAKCIAFIEEIGKVHTKIASGKDGAINKVTASYTDFVSCIDRILFARKNILLPRQANIFTSNYDMFIEYAACGLPNVILNDGFDRSASLGTEFTFAPERYFDRTYRSGALHSHQTEIPTINLIKIHGSVSWRKLADSVAFSAQSIPALSAADKGDATKAKAYLEKHFLILPNLRKFQAALMERIYYDLLRLFSKAMDQQNVALISFGFSFADEHILDITKRALRNPTSHLIVFSHEKALATDYQAKFAKHRNVTVIAPDAGTKIDFERLNKILSAILSGQADAAA